MKRNARLGPDLHCALRVEKQPGRLAGFFELFYFLGAGVAVKDEQPAVFICLSQYNRPEFRCTRVGGSDNGQMPGAVGLFHAGSESGPALSEGGFQPTTIHIFFRSLLSIVTLFDSTV